MSERSGMLCAFVMLLWIAVYVGTGKAHENHDEVMTACWLVFMATLLFAGAWNCTRVQRRGR